MTRNYIASPAWLARWADESTARPAHSSEMLPLLGLKPGGHLPKEGMPSRFIQGIEVWVEPIRAGDIRSCSHRIMARCPQCSWVGSAGRLHQHSKVHPAWPCKLIGDTTGANGKPRQIRATIDGSGDVKAAIYRYMKRRPRSGEWLGVELRAITPLGQTVREVYEPNQQ